jgi:hypothetical protein
LAAVAFLRVKTGNGLYSPRAELKSLLFPHLGLARYVTHFGDWTYILPPYPAIVSVVTPFWVSREFPARNPLTCTPGWRYY